MFTFRECKNRDYNHDIPERDRMTYQERLEKWIKKQPKDKRAEWESYKGLTKTNADPHLHSLFKK